MRHSLRAWVWSGSDGRVRFAAIVGGGAVAAFAVAYGVAMILTMGGGGTKGAGAHHSALGHARAHTQKPSTNGSHPSPGSPTATPPSGTAPTSPGTDSPSSPTTIPSDSPAPPVPATTSPRPAKSHKHHRDDKKPKH